MKLNTKVVVITIFVIGAIFLIGGVGATLNKTQKTAACEACGMEVIKTDSSTFRVVSSDGEEHWACCAICAMIEGIYYTNSEVHGECFSCGSKVVIVFRESELAWLDFSGNNEFVKVLFGGSCMKNKLTCSGSCATSIRQTFDWASDLPTKSLQESTGMARNKLSTMTVAYRPTKIPALNYALIGIGIVLTGAASLMWRRR